MAASGLPKIRSGWQQAGMRCACTCIKKAFSIHIPARRRPAILKKLARGRRRLTELKGIAASIPNQGILINTLGPQEAKDRSEIEHIVTTHDELFKDDVLPDAFANPASKEGAALPPGAARGV